MKYKSKIFDYNTTDYDKLSISQLKRQADYWLRYYLIQDTSRNPQYCPIKKRHYNLSEMQVAHYIDRGKSMWTRYDLTNCHMISSQSNMWDAQILVDGYKSKHHKEYQEFLISEYGFEVLEILKKKSENKEIFRRENYIEVINGFRK